MWLKRQVFVASVFCYDQAIKHDIRLKIHSNEHIQYTLYTVLQVATFSSSNHSWYI